MPPLTFAPEDLAPGDARSDSLDLSAFRFDRIRSVHHPLFELAYARLWAEFGARQEMERRETLQLRFECAPRMLYEMILVRRDGAFVAVRDHTAIMMGDQAGAVVHLSHLLVAAGARRTGLAGWLRALPIQTARECLFARGVSPRAPITLVAEMEYGEGGDPARAIRLAAYEKAGFKKIDPAVVPYHQPDFRAPEVIDATGGARPIPLQLIVRRVGRERETAITGRELRLLVESIYDIYRVQLRAQEMAHPGLQLDQYPPDDWLLSLVEPTRAIRC